MGINMKKLRVVIIGAGSADFGAGMITDLITSEELNEFDLTVALVDVDKLLLDRMLKFAQLIKEFCNSNIKIETSTNRKDVLSGANYVIASVAQKRWSLWEKDFYIPAAYGFRHIFGENGGPGAAFHTLRSLKLMIPIAKDMEKLCSDAMLINFTNPESRICLGISKLTNIRAVGLCHGPMETLSRISEILGKTKNEIDLTIGGINHFHWALEIKDKKTGADLYPEIERRIKQFDWGIDTLTPLMYEFFGYIGYPVPSHPGEYVNFAHEISGPQFIKWGLGEVSRKFNAKASDLDYVSEGRSNHPSYELLSIDKKDKINRIIEGKEPLTMDFVQPSREIAIPIICDIEFDRNRRELSANVVNENSAISNLPKDAIVEVPIQVNAEGVTPVRVGVLPEVIRGICNLQISIQNLLVEAYQKKSKKFLLQALIIDPLVDSAVRAQQMMETMLKLEADYLPELT